ncbi:MAG TPA: hypothetical protein VGW58_09510 [Pyrinomonadaceae bacterium]|nr:hypothetical protein [Pyrinomonadaceae bacterium]
MSVDLSVSQNLNSQTDKSIENLKPEFTVVCSWCGGIIRSSNIQGSEQMCLICHARMLNDYFRRVRRPSNRKRRS